MRYYMIIAKNRVLYTLYGRIREIDPERPSIWGSELLKGNRKAATGLLLWDSRTST